MQGQVVQDQSVQLIVVAGLVFISDCYLWHLYFVAREYGKTIIVDGIKYSETISTNWLIGNAVMLGSMLAGVQMKLPGETEIFQGRRN